jgi:hypothetical protein
VAGFFSLRAALVNSKRLVACPVSPDSGLIADLTEGLSRARSGGIGHSIDRPCSTDSGHIAAPPRTGAWGQVRTFPFTGDSDAAPANDLVEGHFEMIQSPSGTGY